MLFYAVPKWWILYSNLDRRQRMDSVLRQSSLLKRIHMKEYFHWFASSISIKERCTSKAILQSNSMLNDFVLGIFYRNKRRNSTWIVFPDWTNCNRFHEAITLTFQWAQWRLKSSASRLFTQSLIQAQIKENIKAPRHWSWCGEFTADRRIPHTKGQ